MNLNLMNANVPAGIHPRRMRFPQAVRRSTGLARLMSSTLVAAFAVGLTGTAHAAGQAAANGIGQQIQNMAQELSTATGVTGSAFMYTCAIICFLGGAWAFWMSRQPQSRDGGMIAKGAAGIVLCGLFATGGIWIGKAAQTTGGAASTLTSDAGEVGFGG